MEIQWFPGHMAKTRRLISDNLKLVDVVIELVDARIPLSSRNPEIDRIVNNKPRVLVMNKSDIADADANKRWLSYFKQKGIEAVAVDSLSGRGVNSVTSAIDRVLKDKYERERKKGIIKHSVKMMIVGIPNVGKSSLINRLAGRSAAKTGDRPGVTTAKQWIRLSGKFELLDTPGILWPKFEDVLTARKIAFTGGIKDDILDVEELACYLISFLVENYKDNLITRYKLDDINDLQSYEILEMIAKKRGFLLSKGEYDTLRASHILLDEFRDCRLGNITLEFPN